MDDPRVCTEVTAGELPSGIPIVSSMLTGRLDRLKRMPTEPSKQYPGESLGRPESGPGSVAGFGRRLVGLMIDWAMCLVISLAFFSGNALATLAIFVVEQTVLVGVVGFAVGHRCVGTAVCRLDGSRPGFARAALRTVLLAFVVPAIVFDENSRAGHDVISGTIVVRR